MVEEYAETIKPPRRGEERGCGKKRRKARGGEPRIVKATCTAARFVPVWDASHPKKHDAAALPRAARGVAGPGRWCMRGIRIPDRMRNSDKQERFSGKFAGRFIRARGINREDSPMFRVAVRHYNLIKPHGGPDCKTPAEVAGMEICSRNKWRTLVRNAAVARRPDADARRSSGDRRLLYGKPALESGRLGESRTLPEDFRARVRRLPAGLCKGRCMAPPGPSRVPSLGGAAAMIEAI